MICLLTKFYKTLTPKFNKHHLTSLSASFSTRNSSSNNKIVEQKTSKFTDLLVSNGSKPSPKLVKVVTFFKRFGFSETQIKTVVTKSPFLLTYDLSRNLKPKIDFFQSIGLSQQDVIKIVTLYPYVLSRSLQNTLIPSYDMLKSYYGGKEIATDRIKHWPPLIRCGVIKCLPHNVKTLRDFGVPENRIAKMVTGSSFCGICASTKPNYFREIVGNVKDMGFRPASSSFEKAVHVMAWHNEQNWRKKLNVFKALGFSDSEINDMFKKQPTVFGLSDKKITAAIKFFFEKFSWSPSHLVKYPNALMYSLDKRVVPRCLVLHVLALGNKVKNANVITLLAKTDDEFLERYVNKYKDEIPEVLDAYQGNIKIDHYNFDFK